MYRLDRTAEGWLVIRVEEMEAPSAGGERCAGPFPSRPDAIAWIQARGQEAEREEQQRAVELTEELLSDNALADALAVAAKLEGADDAQERLTNRLARYGVQFAPTDSAPRGRPPPDNSREADIAFEYYWRIRQHVSPTRAVAAVAKAYRVTADHVRKVREEFAPVADYEGRLLTGLRARAVERRGRPQPAKSSARQKPHSANVAKGWLMSLLGKFGPLPANEVLRRASAAGFSRRTIERAKQTADIVSTRNGRAWVWSLTPVKTAKRRI